MKTKIKPSKFRSRIFVQVKYLGAGDCFVKKQGEYVYIKMSESSVKHLNLDPMKCYGMCFNGNTTTMEPDTLVSPSTIDGLVLNASTEDQWEKTFTKSEGFKPGKLMIVAGKTKIPHRSFCLEVKANYPDKCPVWVPRPDGFVEPCMKDLKDFMCTEHGMVR